MHLDREQCVKAHNFDSLICTVLSEGDETTSAETGKLVAEEEVDI